MAFTEKQVTQAAADRYEALEDFDSESDEESELAEALQENDKEEGVEFLEEGKTEEATRELYAVLARLTRAVTSVSETIDESAS